MKTRSFASRASVRRVSPAGLPCFRQEEGHTERLRHGALLREPLPGEKAPCRATLFPAGGGSTRRDEDAEPCFASLCPTRKPPAGRPCFRQEEEAHGEMKTRRFASRASVRRGSPAGLPCFQQEGEAHGKMKARSFASRASVRRESPAGLPCFRQEGKHTEAQRHGALLREPLPAR